VCPRHENKERERERESQTDSQPDINKPKVHSDSPSLHAAKGVAVFEKGLETRERERERNR